ncbi:hypothetical protein FEM48_Zijuj12G0215200 [Ziziphus jujuba var. spinosa]|uniref:Uncharacterized protein n=1 Tax=Ziziphus jujuba var. spinosa TaxID=714518 RepID=A0A978UFN3_ZIZJJ|nr:hypothetical protein FEM48_Zijuj12G0214900 [Ziziphus jujuba var. spinosa]KAH7513579.1 hypothetical protein FEM48_Zijuj12G0215200 [Ziziphus jujuba var. spinosa]
MKSSATSSSSDRTGSGTSSAAFQKKSHASSVSPSSSSVEMKKLTTKSSAGRTVSGRRTLLGLHLRRRNLMFRPFLRLLQKVEKKKMTKKSSASRTVSKTSSEKNSDSETSSEKNSSFLSSDDDEEAKGSSGEEEEAKGAKSSSGEEAETDENKFELDFTVRATPWRSKNLQCVATVTNDDEIVQDWVGKFGNVEVVGLRVVPGLPACPGARFLLPQLICLCADENNCLMYIPKRDAISESLKNFLGGVRIATFIQKHETLRAIHQLGIPKDTKDHIRVEACCELLVYYQRNEHPRMHPKLDDENWLEYSDQFTHVQHTEVEDTLEEIRSKWEDMDYILAAKQSVFACSVAMRCRNVFDGPRLKRIKTKKRF